MSKLIDITGKVFGSLTVLSFNGVNSDGKALWSCQCSCGKLVIKRGKLLRKGKELFCGNDHPTKICSGCKIDKDKSEYSKNTSPIGIQSTCKECQSMLYKKNKNIIREKYVEEMKDPKKREKKRSINKISRRKNREQQNSHKKEYEQREYVKKRRRDAHQYKKQNNIVYVIKRRLRWRVRDAVKRINGKGYKYKSSLVLLGCDMDYFKFYLENKFTEGMGWNNISEWHIDHIRPCSSFDLTKLSEQIKCFHYSNLQPLWEVDNLIKGISYENIKSNTPLFNSLGCLTLLRSSLDAPKSA